MSYDNCFASVYDIFTEDVDYESRGQYLCSILSENGINKGIVLDAACGTGTISQYLLKSSFDVVANDISFDMLNIARNKLSEFGDRVLLLCQDMCELDLYGTVDAAVCCLDSINHLLDEEDVEAAFSSINLFLNPGGIFIFDVNTIYKHQNVLAEKTFVYENENRAFLVWQNSECDDDHVVEMYLDIFMLNDDGSYNRQSDVIIERAYSIEVLTDILYRTGFELVALYGDLSKEEPSEKEERVYFVVRKK